MKEQDNQTESVDFSEKSPTNMRDKHLQTPQGYNFTGISRNETPQLTKNMASQVLIETGIPEENQLQELDSLYDIKNVFKNYSKFLDAKENRIFKKEVVSGHYDGIMILLRKKTVIRVQEAGLLDMCTNCNKRFISQLELTKGSHEILNICGCQNPYKEEEETEQFSAPQSIIKSPLHRKRQNQVSTNKKLQFDQQHSDKLYDSKRVPTGYEEYSLDIPLDTIQDEFLETQQSNQSQSFKILPNVMQNRKVQSKTATNFNKKLPVIDKNSKKMNELFQNKKLQITKKKQKNKKKNQKSTTALNFYDRYSSGFNKTKYDMEKDMQYPISPLDEFSNDRFRKSFIKKFAGILGQRNLSQRNIKQGDHNRIFYKMKRLIKNKKSQKWRQGYNKVQKLSWNTSTIGFFSTKQQMDLRKRKNLMNVVGMNNSVTGPQAVKHVAQKVENYCKGLIQQKYWNQGNPNRGKYRIYRKQDNSQPDFLDMYNYINKQKYTSQRSTRYGRRKSYGGLGHYRKPNNFFN